MRRPHQLWKWPLWVMLSGAEKRELANLLGASERPVWNGTPALLREFQGQAACVRRYDASQVTRLTLSVNAVLLHLLEALRAQSVGAGLTWAGYHRTVERFFKELHENATFCASEWTLGSMARHCKMGTTRFSRCSHDLVNVSPWEYLVRCRLDHAAQLLRQKPLMKVTDIAFECGFASSQYFATRFRRQFKGSPRAYRTGMTHP